MELKKAGYIVTMINDPLQAHVIAWERALNAMRSEDAKPIINDAILELNKLKVTESDFSVLFAAFQIVSKSLKEAITILNENEYVSLSAHRSLIVKAGLRSEWITGITKDDITIAEDEIDNQPPWLVLWIAETLSGAYNKAQHVPKS